MSTKRRSAFHGGFLSHTRYIFAGGFPGAGKTTSLEAAGRHFQTTGRRVGFITNDHGGESVDPAVLRAGGWTTEEVMGGSLAARFRSLVQATRRLEKDEVELIFVEPVGSSADLASSVFASLRRELGETGVIAPLSVLVDPLLAEQHFELEPGQGLGEALRHLYRLQLEEAELIVIAQADRLEKARLERLRAKLAAEFAQARVLALSARDGQGLAEWCALLENGTAAEPERKVDYEIYAEGVAQLGWLDSTIELTLAKSIEGPTLLESVGRHLQAALAGIAIAHVKVALRVEGEDVIGLLHLVRGEPEITRQLELTLDFGELIINLRAETHPEKLHTALRAAIVEFVREYPGMTTEFAHLHYFRPARPVPSVISD